MRRRAHPSLPILLVAAAIAVFLGGLFLEVTLVHATHEARAGLDDVLARASTVTHAEHDDAALLREARRLAKAQETGEVARLLDLRTQSLATAETHALAAYAYEADGRFPAAARHATFASRLAPDDAALAARAETAVDRALLARLRTAARVLALVTGLYLACRLVARSRRKARARHLAHWLSGLEGEMAFVADGRAGDDGECVYLGPRTTSLALDFHFSPAGAVRQPPKPGPTLAVVLSHAASNTTLRLTPLRDVREDAVRIRVKAETLGRLLATPGTWRLQARLDRVAVAEARLEVAPPPPSHARKLKLLAWT